MKVSDKQDLALMQRIKTNPEVLSCIPEKSAMGRAVQIKPVCMLMGYLYGLFSKEELEKKNIKKDLEAIMRAMPSYLDIML